MTDASMNEPTIRERFEGYPDDPATILLNTSASWAAEAAGAVGLGPHVRTMCAVKADMFQQAADALRTYAVGKGVVFAALDADGLQDLFEAFREGDNDAVVSLAADLLGLDGE